MQVSFFVWMWMRRTFVFPLQLSKYLSNISQCLFLNFTFDINDNGFGFDIDRLTKSKSKQAGINGTAQKENESKPNLPFFSMDHFRRRWQLLRRHSLRYYFRQSHEICDKYSTLGAEEKQNAHKQKINLLSNSKIKLNEHWRKEQTNKSK